MGRLPRGGTVGCRGLTQTGQKPGCRRFRMPFQVHRESIPPQCEIVWGCGGIFYGEAEHVCEVLNVDLGPFHTVGDAPRRARRDGPPTCRAAPTIHSSARAANSAPAPASAGCAMRGTESRNAATPPDRLPSMTIRGPSGACTTVSGRNAEVSWATTASGSSIKTFAMIRARGIGLGAQRSARGKRKGARRRQYCEPSLTAF